MTGKQFRGDDAFLSPHGRTAPSSGQPPGTGPAYRQTSVHLTDELWTWARDLAIDATRAGPAKITASEVIRLAMSRLQDDLAARPPRLDLAAELADQAHREAQQYQGRRARNLPRLA